MAGVFRWGYRPAQESSRTTLLCSHYRPELHIGHGVRGYYGCTPFGRFLIEWPCAPADLKSTLGQLIRLFGHFIVHGKQELSA